MVHPLPKSIPTQTLGLRPKPSKFQEQSWLGTGFVLSPQNKDHNGPNGLFAMFSIEDISIFTHIKFRTESFRITL